MKKVFLAFGVLFASMASYAQQTISVDNSKGTINPIVKRYGTNLPATTSFSELKNHQSDLKDLGIQYVRLSAGWGEEGSGLYDAKQVTRSGDNVTVDFSRIDEIVDLISASGAQTAFVLRTPQDFGAVTAAPDASGSGWYNLNKQFAAHWLNRGLVRPTYEVLERIDDQNYFTGSAEEYDAIYRQAANGIFDGEGRTHIKTNVYPAAVVGGMEGSILNTFVNYIKDADGHADVRNDRMQALGGNALGIDQLVGRYKSFNETRNAGHDWSFQWETVIQEFDAADRKAAESVDNTAVIQLLQSVRETFFYNDVTRIYMSQLLDGQDGTKGLISADGKKTPLYYALQLLNKMPSDRKQLTGTSDPIYAFASSDATRAAIVVWNESFEGSQNVTVNLNNLPFTSGKVKLYRIDAANSSNGVLAEETLANLSGSTLTATVDVPAKGAIYIIAENDKEVTTYAPLGGYLTDHHMYWFKFTEGWASHSFDPATMTVYLVDRNDYPDWGGDDKGDWGVAHTAIEIADAPEVVNVKVDQIGQVQYKDPNSAIYFRIDYERKFVDEDEDVELVYYGNGTVFYDNLFDPEHGSNPDAYPNGLKETEAVKVDYSAADGVNVTLAEYAPRDWTGNIRLIAYLQNPGAHAEGLQVKMQFRDPSKTISNGIDEVVTNVAAEAANGAIYNIAGQKVSANYNGIVIINGKKYLKR